MRVRLVRTPADLTDDYQAASRRPLVVVHHRLHVSAAAGVLGPLREHPQDYLKILIAEKADQFPPGLMEQYEVLYENLAKSDFPAIELVAFPFNAVPPVEGDRGS